MPRYPHRPRPVRRLAPVVVAAMGLLFTTVSSAADDGWLAFADGQHRPAFEVGINGERALALIDTGLSVNALSTDAARRAGVEQGPRSVSVEDLRGGDSVPLSEAFELDIGGASIELDSAAMTPIEGVDLVIGRPMLNALLIQIDYPERRLRLLPRDAADLDGNVQARRDAMNRPMVRARINGKRGWLVLDTANAGFTMLKPEVVARHDMTTVGADAVAAAGIALAGAARAVRLGELELGPFTLANALAATPTGDDPVAGGHGSGRIHDRSGSDGILGYEVLRNFVVTLRLADNEVHLFAP